MWFWFFWISLFVNFLSLFYIRWLLKTVAAINSDIENVTGLIYQFSLHVKSLHDLEMFYGDPTLQSLITHSKDLVSELEEIDLILNVEKEDLDAKETPEEN